MAFIAEREHEPFSWGRNDCCLFACDAVAQMTGVDMAAPDFRSQYDTALSAHRLLREHGGVEAVAEKQTAAHGFQEVPVSLAQRGDVLLMDTDVAGPALGVCIGAQGAFPGHHSLTFVPVASCRRAWKIS